MNTTKRKLKSSDLSKISSVGLDIAKSSFSLACFDRKGNLILKKTLRRAQVLVFFSKLPKCLIGMEACGGSNFWAKELEKLGHTVKLMAPQYVKPYIKTNKNDMADAEGIGEALSRPTMRFVGKKSQFQQDLQSIHRVRQRLVRNRTALCNEIRGILYEYGIIIPKGVNQVRKLLVPILEDETGNKLSEIISIELHECYNRLVSIDNRINELEQRLWNICKSIDTIKMLLTIPGVGKLTASAIVAKVGDISMFQNARQFSAWLGLVPKHEGTGGKYKIMGISKRGDKYLRQLLVHGARSALNHCPGKSDRLSVWVTQVFKRRGRHKAIVALANKNARIIFSVLTKGEDYRSYPIQTAEAV